MTKSQEESRVGEQYSLAQLPEFERSLATRNVDNSAAFFVKHLRPEMRVLDCGCGPGTITVGLAEAVPGGEVAGIDIDAKQIESAQALAAEKRIGNVRFEVANAHELPFPPASFDAVFANALLIHLSDPGSALSEIKRVLRPGGVIGIRDADRGFDLRVPETPRLKRMFELWVRVLEHNGGSPHYARNQRQLLVAAGFERVTTSVMPLTYTSAEVTRRNAQGTRNVFLGLARTAIEQGWTDHAETNAICDDILAWGERPDAFGMTLWFSTVGWLPGELPLTAIEGYTRP